MADADLIKLYSQRILALAADVPNAERLGRADGSATKRSPLCGSTVTVDVRIADNRLDAIGMDVKACALGQASAAVLGGGAVGKSRESLAAARDALAALLKGREDALDSVEGDFEALSVLTPARDYKNRHASILLAWDAVLDAYDAAELRNAAAPAGC